MPAASSSPIDLAIGQLLAAAQSLDQEPARLLPVLAAVPIPGRAGGAAPASGDPGPGGVRGAGRRRSFTAIAEWAADADRATRDALGVAGVVPCESRFRRTLQSLDADALDDAAGSWAQQRTAPGARHITQDCGEHRDRCLVLYPL